MSGRPRSRRRGPANLSGSAVAGRGGRTEPEESSDDDGMHIDRSHWYLLWYLARLPPSLKSFAVVKTRRSHRRRVNDFAG